MPRFDFSKIFCENTPMPTRIPEALRQIIAEQYGEDQIRGILAQVFLNGASVVFHPNGTKEILPNTILEIRISDDVTDEDFTPLETPIGEWGRLFHRPPKETEIAVFPGNFRQGAQGKFEENTWKKDDLTNEDAQVCRGHGEPGHRGGMRHATSRPVLMKFLDQSYKVRRYR